MSASKGITGKVGSWSARHPWTAITLWIAFVAAAVVIGSAVGTKQLTEAESASGESGVAARTLDKAGFKIQPGEQVLVQSKTLTRRRPGLPRRRRRRHPAPRAHAERRQAALAVHPEHDLQGRPLRARLVRDPGHVQHRRRQGRAGPEDHRRGAGRAPGVHDRGGRRRQLREGLQRHAGQGLREGGAALAAHHAADPRDRVRRPPDRRHPGAPRDERRLLGARPDRGREPAAAGHRRHAVGDPPDRPRRRRRLLDLLHRPRAPGARAGRRAGRRDRDRRRHLRAAPCSSRA